MIEKLIYKILRSSIQGESSNEEYPESLLRDYRLMYQHPTLKVKKWKNFESAGRDSKFTDLKKDDIFAEGKCISKDRGVTFKPSVDTGANRSFSQENLEKCFEKNAFYFLYEICEITDIDVTFEIYWIPILIIKDIYNKFGKNGSISYNKFKTCISQYEIELTG